MSLLKSNVCLIFTDVIYKMLSFKYAYAFEKLIPINIIITPIVIRLLVFTADAPVYWSSGQAVSQENFYIFPYWNIVFEIDFVFF